MHLHPILRQYLAPNAAPTNTWDNCDIVTVGLTVVAVGTLESDYFTANFSGATFCLMPGILD
jgi:hypothetical protein